MPHFVVATFYKFVDFADYAEWREPLRAFAAARDVKGSILLAPEGINATISGAKGAVTAVLDFLEEDARFAALTVKWSDSDVLPFARLKVRLKREIVNLGQPEINPNNGVGTYVPAGDWNELIHEPDVVLIDTRNDFEYQIGTFSGALNPHTAAFNEFPDFVSQNLDPARHKKVAMFCTGGIRCEKATALLLARGFTEVYHLQGGILKYLEEVPAEESEWQGDCFVFDDRVALGHGLAVQQRELCPVCKSPINDGIRQSAQYRKGVYCPRCRDSLTPDRIVRLSEKQRQKELGDTPHERSLA